MVQRWLTMNGADAFRKASIDAQMTLLKKLWKNVAFEFHGKETTLEDQWKNRRQTGLDGEKDTENDTQKKGDQSEIDVTANSMDNNEAAHPRWSRNIET